MTKNKKKVNKKLKSKNTKNKQSIIDKFIPKTLTEKLLTVTFITLLFIVIILGIKAKNVKEEYQKRQEADLTIPILEKTTNNTFLVDLSNMKKDQIKEYKFMITNYKDKKQASTEINYDIEITNNSTSAQIKLYKNNETKNLLTSESSTNNIKGNKLTKDKKSTDSYYLIIRAKEDIKEKENISIKITGIN